jgi:hypothetical protein
VEALGFFSFFDWGICCPKGRARGCTHAYKKELMQGKYNQAGDKEVSVRVRHQIPMRIWTNVCG